MVLQCSMSENFQCELGVHCKDLACELGELTNRIALLHVAGVGLCL